MNYEEYNPDPKISDFTDELIGQNIGAYRVTEKSGAAESASLPAYRPAIRRAAAPRESSACRKLLRKLNAFAGFSSPVI
jgi:hypothetical protein